MLSSSQSDLNQFQQYWNSLTPAQRAELQKALVAPAAFRATYEHDPVAFVHDCINWKDGESTTFYQDNILAELHTKRHVCVRGPRGLGKTTTSALSIVHYSLTRDAGDPGTVGDWKIATTAGAYRQLERFLWPEIHKWMRRVKWDKIGRKALDTRTEMMQMSLKLVNGQAFAAASDNSDLIEGAHADYLYALFDESKAIEESTFNGMQGAFSNAGSDTNNEGLWLAVSTPGEPLGWFYDIHARKPGYEHWTPIHVTLEDTIKAKRLSNEWANNMRRQWGEDSAAFRIQVLGEFASSDEDGVIPLAWIEKANKRWEKWERTGKPGRFISIGVDVARKGEDKTIIATRFQDDEETDFIDTLEEFSQRDTMETSGLIVNRLDRYGKTVGRATIDVIGLGAGPVDRVRELGYTVLAFNANDHTDKRDETGEMGFHNSRSAEWWTLRTRLDPTGEHPIGLPPDDILTGELVAPKWSVTSTGKIQVEGKKDIRKRLDGRSTDRADAVVYALFDPPKRRKKSGSSLPVSGKKRYRD